MKRYVFFSLLTILLVSGCIGTTQETAEESVADETTGNRAAYIDYSKTAFDQARAGGNTIYLEFYAPWCPYCRAQEPKIKAAFEQMSQDGKYANVVGFKVDYDSEKALKQQYGITYQHSRIILDKEGSVVVKSIGETWTSEQIIVNVEKAL